MYALDVTAAVLSPGTPMVMTPGPLLPAAMVPAALVPFPPFASVLWFLFDGNFGFPSDTEKNFLHFPHGCTAAPPCSQGKRQ